MPRLVFNNEGFDLGPYGIIEANRILGAYMAAFSELEISVSFAFRALTGLDGEVARVVFDRIKNKEQIEIVGEIAKIDDRLGGEFTEVGKLLSACGVTRNKIVHASWGLYDDELARYHNMLTSEVLDKLRGEAQKAESTRKKFIVTVSEIVDATNACAVPANMCREISSRIHAIKARASMDAVAARREASMRMFRSPEFLGGTAEFPNPDKGQPPQ